MVQNSNKRLTQEQSSEIIMVLKNRFHENMVRHEGMDWTQVEQKLKRSPEKLWSLSEMEKSGGEPDVIEYDETTGQYHFYDCSAESPAGRRSLCYDRAALDSRKENKPEGSAVEMAEKAGFVLLNENQYRKLQEKVVCDRKTSSWISTPEDIRKQGGALFADFRYGHVFIYHNGAPSYYAARGFRGMVNV